MTVLATDNFNRSASTLGANWSEYGSFSNAWNATGTVATPDSFGADCYAAYNATFPNDQYSQVKVAITGTFGNGQGPGPAVRMGTALPENVYRLCMDHAATSNMELSKFVGGTFTSKWVRTQAFTDGDTLYLEIRGTTLIAKLNGSAIGTSITDSSLSSGNAGIGFSSGTTSVATLDDFEGGDFGTPWGYNTIGASNDNSADNWVWCKATSTPASSGLLTSINAYCAQLGPQTGGGSTLDCALYSDSSGAPGSLLTASSHTPVAVAASFSWVTVDVSADAFSVVSGTQYWFAVRAPAETDGAPNNNDVNFKFDTNGGATEGYFKNTGFSNANVPFPSTVSGATSFTNERWSVYGTYTPSSGQDTPELYGRMLGALSTSRQTHQLLSQ